MQYSWTFPRVVRTSASTLYGQNVVYLNICEAICNQYRPCWQKYGTTVFCSEWPTLVKTGCAYLWSSCSVKFVLIPGDSPSTQTVKPTVVPGTAVGRNNLTP